jgi:hypothetical protein
MSRETQSKIIDNNNETGQDRKDFPHFTRLNEILGPQPETQPLIGELSDREEAGDGTDGKESLLEETRNESKEDRSENQESNNQETKQQKQTRPFMLKAEQNSLAACIKLLTHKPYIVITFTH